jgi:hypothetical protein
MLNRQSEDVKREDVKRDKSLHVSRLHFSALFGFPFVPPCLRASVPSQTYVDCTSIWVLLNILVVTGRAPLS